MDLGNGFGAAWGSINVPVLRTSKMVLVWCCGSRPGRVAETAEKDYEYD